MTAAYWNQWSRTELLSWQGVELNDYQNDDHNDNHCDSDIEKECSCVCMQCLGMSWEDFI
jgi:hypothetical protein